MQVAPGSVGTVRHQVDPPYRVTFGDETFVDVDYDPMTPGKR